MRSRGLDRAQARILEPLTGVGTDLSVTRPIEIAASGSSGAQNVEAALAPRGRDAALAGRATRVVSMRDGRLAGRLDPQLVALSH